MSDTRLPPRRSRAAMDALLLLMVVIWGSNYSLLKILFSHVAPMPFNAVRLVISSVVFLGLVVWDDRGRGRSSFAALTVRGRRPDGRTRRAGPLPLPDVLRGRGVDDERRQRRADRGVLARGDCPGVSGGRSRAHRGRALGGIGPVAARAVLRRRSRRPIQRGVGGRRSHDHGVGRCAGRATPSDAVG